MDNNMNQNNQQYSQQMYMNNQQYPQQMYVNNQQVPQQMYVNNQQYPQQMYVNNQQYPQQMYANNQQYSQQMYMNNQQVPQQMYMNNQQAQQQQSQQASKPKKPGAGKKIIIALVCLLLVAGITVGALFATGVIGGKKKSGGNATLDRYFDALNDADMYALVDVLYPDDNKMYRVRMSNLEQDMALVVYKAEADFIPEMLFADYMRFDLDLMDECFPGFKDAYNNDQNIDTKELKKMLSNYKASYRIIEQSDVKDGKIQRMDGLRRVDMSKDDFYDTFANIYEVDKNDIKSVKYFILDVDFSVDGKKYGLFDKYLEKTGGNKKVIIDRYDELYSNFLLFVVDINGHEYVNTKLGHQCKLAE